MDKKLSDLEKNFQFRAFLMEGALGERLKHEYEIYPDEHVALAGHIYDQRAQKALYELWNGYIKVAQRYGFPFLATTPTRRANRERVATAKYNESIIRDNAEFLRGIRDRAGIEMYVGALIGCKGDAYKATGSLSEAEAERFHSWEIELFADCGVDFFFAGIMPALTEASGMSKALARTKAPYIISFMIRDDGKLIDGTPLHDAIAYIDETAERPPLCYMTNCVHPDILYRALRHNFNRTTLVQTRFCGIQANASPLSPEDLDHSPKLHSSDPEALASGIIQLKELIDLKIIGGCCGTDHLYMDSIARRLVANIVN